MNNKQIKWRKRYKEADTTVPLRVFKRCWKVCKGNQLHLEGKVVSPRVVFRRFQEVLETANWREV